jgi:vacuolar-type H+-ATPase subunit E/Vma4
LPSPQTAYEQLRHVAASGAVCSSHDLNAIAFAGGFDVYVGVITTSNHGSVRVDSSTSSFSVTTSLV